MTARETSETAKARNIEFGWGAPSFAEQLPYLSPSDAEAFDADNKAIIRLSVRGIITSSERDKAITRCTKLIALTLSQESGR